MYQWIGAKEEIVNTNENSAVQNRKKREKKF